MIDVKEAVQKAKDFAKDVLGTSDLLVEEVSSDEDAFEVTLSFPRRVGMTKNPLIVPDPLRSYAVDREFKEFRVMKANGTVTKMAIREIA